jgi:hypothetical protein
MSAIDLSGYKVTDTYFGRSAFAHPRLDGEPVYPQHPVPRMSSLMGVCYAGQYRGK